MLLVKNDRIYQIPFNFSGTLIAFQKICSILQKDEKEYILSFNNIFLSKNTNYKFLEIGYSPNEQFEMIKNDIKLAVFNIFSYEVNYILNVDKYSNIYTIKQYFAEIFYTVPSNIIIKQDNQIVPDYFSIILNRKQFEVFVKEDYFLVKTYFDKLHLVCMHLNSTVENLKETISIYSQKNEGIETKCIFSDNLLRMYNDIDFKKDDKIELQILAVSVPFFEFNQTKLEDCQFFTINVVIKDDEFGIEFTEKIESKYELSIYSVTVMLEKKFGIERSLFIPFDGNGDKIQLNEVVTSEQNSLLFKIFDSLTVEIDGNEKKFSYLTQISDIQMMNNFTNHNFAIIINNHFIYKKPDGYSLLCNFMTNSKETTKLILKKAKEPCYQKIIKDQNYFCKYAIIPKNMEIEQITQNYLRRNLNSVDILKNDDNEIVFKNSNRQIIKYILIKENNRSYERSIEIAGNNLFVKDLLFEIYGSKGYFGLFRHNTKENTQFEVTMSKCNYKKFKFWEPLSSIKIEKNNIITIKELNGPKEILMMNLIDNTFYCEKIPIVRKNTNEIIDYFCCKQKLDKNNIMLYSDFNELCPADIPSIFQLDHQFLIINKKSNKKTLNIKNKYQLKIEITVEKKNYSNAASIICDIFKLPINEVRITATLNDKNYILPMKFDAGSLPDHCEMLIEYDEDDHVSGLMTYKYKNENKVLHISYINSIESSIKILQKEFKLWHLSKSAIYLSFHSFIFPPTKELVSY